MLISNCDEIHAIPPSSSTTNQWSSTQTDEMIDQNHHHKISSSSSSSSSSMPSTSSLRAMDQKPGQHQQQQQQQQQALKCPRCDSSNTKFCYYNNYNLSQPRHFCKACKRYWTRGGTLRNVPVGGGCRKNHKRQLKRHTPSTSSSSNIHDTTTTTNASPSSSTITTYTAPTSNPPNNSQSQQINPYFYGLPSSNNNNSCDVMNLLPFPGFATTTTSRGYDPQLNGLGGLGGFSSGMNNGFTSSNNNNTFLSSTYNSIFGSTSSNSHGPASTPPLMASLLNSNNLLHQKFMNGGNSFQQGSAAAPVQELQLNRSGNTAVMASKEVKGGGDIEGSGGGGGEDERRLLAWNIGQNHHHHHQQMEEHVTPFSDPNSLYWNTSATALGSSSWTTDQPNANIGPNSLTSLI